MTGPVAAIDCGTNSTRLLVAETTADGKLQTLERSMRITRLGRGVDGSGALDPASITATLDVLREYRATIDRFGVTRLRAAATSAIRDASNSGAFMGPAKEILGVAPEAISGAEEARLSFVGATAELDGAAGPFLVVDIGGGSTEFSFGIDECEVAISADIGCVRMSEKYFEHDPPLPEELYWCLSEVRQHLEEVQRDLPQVLDEPRFVGLAGTVSTTAAVEIGLAEYDRDRIHHFTLTKVAVEDVFRTLATERLEDRVHNPGLERERADVIVGGLCILVAIMRKWGLSECLVSEADILDGIASGLM